MSRLIESIRLCNGRYENLPYHQDRVDRAFSELFGRPSGHDLAAMLSSQKIPTEGLYKCRVVYDRSEFAVDVSLYERRLTRTLQIVADDAVSYSHKFQDRKALATLFEKRGSCDDILIIKKGFVTDSYIANIVFKRGDEWITPESCLLKGTMRQMLLDRQIISAASIRKEDIFSFQSFKLVNAMLGFESPETDIKNIIS